MRYVTAIAEKEALCHMGWKNGSNEQHNQECKGLPAGQEVPQGSHCHEGGDHRQGVYSGKW